MSRIAHSHQGLHGGLGRAQTLAVLGPVAGLYRTAYLVARLAVQVYFFHHGASNEKDDWTGSLPRPQEEQGSPGPLLQAELATRPAVPRKGHSPALPGREPGGGGGGRRYGEHPCEVLGTGCASGLADAITLEGAPLVAALRKTHGANFKSFQSV